MIDFIVAISKPSYWFTHQAIVPDFWVTTLSILFGLILLLAVVMVFLSTRKQFYTPFRTLFGRISVWSWFFGITGYVLLFFSVQRISFLSARLNYLLWFIGAIAWAYPIIRYALKDIPRLVEQKKEKAEKEKWLPKAAK